MNKLEPPSGDKAIGRVVKLGAAKSGLPMLALLLVLALTSLIHVEIGRCGINNIERNFITKPAAPGGTRVAENYLSVRSRYQVLLLPRGYNT